MVRKIIVLLTAVCALAAVPLGAYAAEVYEGNLSNTYTTIFADIVGKIGYDDEYVFYRSGQNEYTMVAGDITWDGSSFAADEALSYVLYWDSGYNSSYAYYVSPVSNWELMPLSALVYSSLGDYPDLIDRSETYSFATLVLVFVCICLYLIRSIFGWTYRRR